VRHRSDSPLYVIANVVSAHFMYLGKLPHVPEGLVLVHNTNRPMRQLDLNGFRASLSIPDTDKLAGC
jgi:hypothetical protein